MSNFQDALAAFKRGEMIIVVDDENRENEGDLMMRFATRLEFYVLRCKKSVPANFDCL